MGIIHSRIYLNHFPIKTHYTEFTEQEKKTLCHWVNNFWIETKEREIEKIRKGRMLFATYNLDGYDKELMVEMIKNNRFNDEYLPILNAILYRHKFNAVLSLWLFPML